MEHVQYTNFRKKICLIFFLSILNSILLQAQSSIYKPGDIINIEGVNAIVYEVDESGTHGTAMSVKCLRAVKEMWCNDTKLGKLMPKTSNESNGLSNTQCIIEFAKSKKALSKFPVYEWCDNLGKDWYVPSLKELESFVNFWLGNEQEIDWDSEEEKEIDESTPYYKKINEAMINAGGIPFINGVFTSTVDDDGEVYVFWFNRQKHTWRFKKSSKTNLSNYYVGRAFHKF